MQTSYWLKQSSTKPLYPEIEWNKPEQKSRAGRLAIIGGNKLGFATVATAYNEATNAGVGTVRVILPDALKPVIPPTILDTLLVPSNPSGGMSQDSKQAVAVALTWADHGLLIGDAGRNSETAIIYESLLAMPTPLTITRDAVDLLKNASQQMVDRPNTTLVVSFAQLQKLFQSVYYPKMLSFSMQLSLLVETLHKFSLTYPAIIVTFHQNQLIVAKDGKVVTQEFDDPMRIWRGSVATRVACYQIWTPTKSLESTVASIL